jgi:phosphatidylserine synthase
MVSTIRFRSVKAIDVGWRRSYVVLFVLAVALALIASHPRLALVALAYSYTLGALVLWAYTRLRRHSAAGHVEDHPAPEAPAPRSLD